LVLLVLFFRQVIAGRFSALVARDFVFRERDAVLLPEAALYLLFLLYRFRGFDVVAKYAELELIQVLEEHGVTFETAQVKGSSGAGLLFAFLGLGDAHVDSRLARRACVLDGLLVLFILADFLQVLVDYRELRHTVLEFDLFVWEYNNVVFLKHLLQLVISFFIRHLIVAVLVDFILPLDHPVEVLELVLHLPPVARPINLLLVEVAGLVSILAAVRERVVMEQLRQFAWLLRLGQVVRLHGDSTDRAVIRLEAELLLLQLSRGFEASLV